MNYIPAYRVAWRSKYMRAHAFDYYRRLQDALEAARRMRRDGCQVDVFVTRVPATTALRYLGHEGGDHA